MFKRNVRFGPTMSSFELQEYSYKGRQIYQVDVRTIIDGPYDIRIREVADGSGDGVVFFPPAVASYPPPIIGWYSVPDVSKPSPGSIGLDELEASERKFTMYIATERPLATAYLDVRYTVLDEKQTEKRRLLKLPLQGNN
ncbi:hypothetical protein [Mesorhizobium sp. WSM4311]|nr:hypothetical protein [Mesorhizobium sp. WSM4311]